MASNKLELASLQARATLIPLNKFNSEDPGNNYSAKHTFALSDTLSPNRGMGTGIFMDTYNGGTNIDINGNPRYAGSGRLAAFANNGSTWGYTPDSGYKAPDTSGNIGQVNF